ncbi:hypothetical protein [Streptomyces collinus]|uniref:hypothetical protein n=1 Tax=Streptomyces collinus TaxID=42684 RepID=UPI0029428691|nr:hypothetical protein [Streptomyces collinus]
MQMAGGGAFDDQESGVVGELLTGVLEQVAVKVVNRASGLEAGEGSDTLTSSRFRQTLSSTALTSSSKESYR